MPASMRVSTPKLDRLRSFLREIGGTYAVVSRYNDPASHVKAKALRRDDRDFWKSNAQMRTEVLRVLRRTVGQTLRMNVSTYEQARVEAAEAIRGVIVTRFKSQTGVRLRPLSPGWKARKRALGLDRRIGIATKDLLRDVERRNSLYLRKTRPG